MAQQTKKVRHVQKHDVEANWLKATGFTPLAGEIVIYDKDEKHDFVRTKIGDGETNINDLPFVKNAIIDVVSLPTDNINQEAIYRVLDTIAYDYGDPLYKPKFNYVNTLPEEGEGIKNPETNDFCFYYNISNGLVYGYINAELSAAAGAEGATLPIGWYDYTTFLQFNGNPDFGTVILAVDELPSTGMPIVMLDPDGVPYNDIWGYYSRREHEVYCYIDDNLSAFINNQLGQVIPSGWYLLSQLAPLNNVNYQGIFTQEEDIPDEGFSILVNNILYTYNNNWNQINKTQIQADWNQQDDTQPDYIKNKPMYNGKIQPSLLYQPDWNAIDTNNPSTILNKPFYTMPAHTILCNEIISFSEPAPGANVVEGWMQQDPLLVENTKYWVYLNEQWLGQTDPIKDNNFQLSLHLDSIIIYESGQIFLEADNPGEYQLKITAPYGITIKLDPKYLPFTLASDFEDNSSSVPTSSVVYNLKEIIQSNQQTNNTKFNNYETRITTNTNNINKLQTKVDYGNTQTLTAAQQSTARKNINAQEQISITSPLRYGDSVYIENGTGLILKGKTVYKNMCSLATTGEFTQTATYDIEPLEPGIYTFSCLAVTNNPSNMTVIHFLDSKGGQITDNAYQIIPNTGERQVFTAAFDKAIHQLRFYAGNTEIEAQEYTATFSDIQIEASHMVTDYEPYQTSQTGIGAEIRFNNTVFIANTVLMDGESIDFINKTVTRSDGTTSSVVATSPLLPNFVKADYPVRTNGEALLTYNYFPFVHYNPQQLTTKQRDTVRKNLNIVGIPGGDGGEQFGYRCVASGYVAHAEGYLTNAEGLAAHAEGIASQATNNSAHAEGNNCQATNAAAHAEGVDTIASGYSSHAEGSKTEATNYYTHAEGYSTKAQGNYAHAEGRHTIAKGDTQHVQGKYNIELGSTYAHIVGNGESQEERSNAHTLDWDGNAWFQGNVYVGGAGQNDTTAKRLLTENDLQDCSLPKVTIFDNGKLLQVVNGEWNAADAEMGISFTDDGDGNVKIEGNEVDFNRLITPEDTTFFILPKNLFNPDTITEGALVSQTNGNIQTNNEYIVSDYIPVTGGQTYVASRLNSSGTQVAYSGTSFRWACYDGDKNYITGAQGTNPMALPENTVYVRFSYYYTWNNQVQFELGTEPTEYVPYGGTTHIKNEYIPQDEELAAAVDGLTERVEVLEQSGGGGGDAVLPIAPDDTTFFVKSKNLFNPNTISTGFFVNQANGALSAGASYIATDFIPVTGGQTYVASYLNSTYGQYPHKGISFRYACYDENKTYISGGNGSDYNPMTLPDNAAFVRYSFYNTQFGNNQFELGAEPTAYELGGTYLDPAYIRLGAEEFVLNLPEKLYALVGEELNIYFDNLVDSHDTDYQFDVTCTVGMQMERCYRLTATTAGSYPITIKATNKDGGSVEKTATIYVADTTAGDGENPTLIVLGDSTTDNGTAITKLNENMTGDVMGVTTLGTRGTSPNNHEGRSGWRFDMYLSTATNNPFYNPDTETFDATYYFANSGVSVPEWFFINLGINDMFGATTDDAAGVAIGKINDYCDSMIASLKTAAPNIKIGVVLTIPPNYSQDAFGKAYACGQTRDRYKRNNALWVQEQIARYDSREDENIYVVPIYTNLDTKYNMGFEEIAVNKRNPDIKYDSAVGNGGVHPSTSGYWQIADVYWFFLKNNT